MKLDRRGFLLTGFASGAATLLPACPSPAPAGPAEGTYASPFSLDDPGPWADKAQIHQPVVYASLVDDFRVRLWIEVRDAFADRNHEMTVDHYVQRLLVQDAYDNVLADRGFRYDAEARIVTVLEIPSEVDVIHALELCNLHGWWRQSYLVSDLKVAPLGDQRRAYTREQPGRFAAQALSHVPILGRRPNGRLAVEVGDRAQGALHPQVEGHYVEQILVYDQFDQLRLTASLGRYAPEAVADFDFPGGTERLRVLAFCSNYSWWEAEYALE